MPPEAGYTRARELLKERFGDSFQILQTWVRKITLGPQVKANDKVQLQQLADDLVCCRETLSAMKALHEIDNQMSLLKIVERLPLFLQNCWKREVRSVRLKMRNPTFDDVVTFVADAAAEMADSVYGNLGWSQNHPERRPESTIDKRRSREAIAGSTSLMTPAICACCGNAHQLGKCQRFKDLSTADRMAFVRQHKLCFNCLAEGHRANKCRLNKVCHIQDCGKRHSPLLHAVQWQQPGVVGQPPSNTGVIIHSAHTISGQDVPGCDVIAAGVSTRQRCCLPIVPVIVRNPYTRVECSTYALLDSGSTNSFCSEDIAKKLDLQGATEMLNLTTLTAVNAAWTASVVDVEVSDVENQVAVELSSVLVKDQLPINAHSKAKTADISQWSHLCDLELHELSTDQVDLLIGQDAPDVLLPVEVRRGEIGSPLAVKAIFGWTVSGPLSSLSSRVISHFITGDAKQQMETFWKSEQMPLSQDSEHGTSFSVDDLRALKTWNDTITMDDG